MAFRARMAIQYGGNIDEVVKHLGTRNNGLYTNEWLMGDAKTNEIAMYELGTAHTKLWRSSKNEWFGDTPGFYWGNNNAKDLTIRTRVPCPTRTARPNTFPTCPRSRDLAWLDFYQKYKGQIDEQFAFIAFRTAPLVSGSTMDAKVITADMANQHDGVGRHRQAQPARMGCPAARRLRQERRPLSLRLCTVHRTGRPISSPKSSRRASTRSRRRAAAAHRAPRPHRRHDRLWKGWILPASDADTWFAAGTAAYHRTLQSDDLEKAIDAATHPVPRPEARPR